MTEQQRREMNDEARRAWDDNAGFWDARMADGNDFLDLLVWPTTQRLLASGIGERVLDIACGNGVTSRRLAASGARVVGVDFSEPMLAHARSRGPASIDYRCVDATDGEALRALGSFDAALCNMALMDMSDIGPLLQALPSLLPPGGRFVFSTLHPAFNNPWTVQMGELEDRDGTLLSTYSVKTSRYLTSGERRGSAMAGQPRPHPYFHRPLHALLAPAFAAGLVLDALEEPGFAAGHLTGSQPLSWSGRFSELPPVLIARLRRPR